MKGVVLSFLRFNRWSRADTTPWLIGGYYCLIRFFDGMSEIQKWFVQRKYCPATLINQASSCLTSWFYQLQESFLFFAVSWLLKLFWGPGCRWQQREKTRTLKSIHPAWEDAPWHPERERKARYAHTTLSDIKQWIEVHSTTRRSVWCQMLRLGSTLSWRRSRFRFHTWQC